MSDQVLGIAELVKERIEKLTSTMEKLSSLITPERTEEEMEALFQMKYSADQLSLQMSATLLEEDEMDRERMLLMLNMADTLHEEVMAI